MVRACQYQPTKIPPQSIQTKDCPLLLFRPLRLPFYNAETRQRHLFLASLDKRNLPLVAWIVGQQAAVRA